MAVLGGRQDGLWRPLVSHLAELVSSRFSKTPDSKWLRKMAQLLLSVLPEDQVLIPSTCGGSKL